MRISVSTAMQRYWFQPKRYGYGAVPTTWQGWAFTGLILVAILGSGWLLLGTGAAHRATTAWIWAAIVMLVVAVSLPAVKAKTEGGWRWRWGDES